MNTFSNLQKIIKDCVAEQARADTLKNDAKMIESGIAEALKMHGIKPKAFKNAYKMHLAAIYNETAEKQLELFKQTEQCLDVMGYVATLSIESKDNE